jgi:hypothetical protein
MRKTIACLILVGYFFWGANEERPLGKERGPFQTWDDCQLGAQYARGEATSECYYREVPEGTAFDEPGFYLP